MPAAPPIPDPRLRGTSWQRFRAGTGYALRGATLLVTRPAWWPWVLAPAALTALFLLGGWGAAWWTVGALMNLIWVPGPETAAWLSWSWWIAGVLLRFSLLIFVATAAYLLAGLVAIPFNDQLSQQVEAWAGHHLPQRTGGLQTLGDLANSILHSALSLFLWLVASLFLALLNLIPGVGSVVAFPLSLTVTALFLARETFDGPQSRRRWGYLHKWRNVRDNWLPCLGFGLIASLGMWIPLFNFVFFPMAVIGGTLLFCHLEDEGRIDAS